MYRWLVFILALTFLTSCNDNEELFEMSYETDVFFTPNLSQGAFHFQDMFGISTMSETLLAANNLTREDVRSIVPKEAQLINIQSKGYLYLPHSLAKMKFFQNFRKFNL